MTPAAFDVPTLFARLAAEERRARPAPSRDARPAAREIAPDLYAGPPTHRDDVHPPPLTTA